MTVGILPAEVVLPPEARMVVAPPLEGRIAEWLVEVGASVEVDTPLARIELLDVGDLQASLEESKRVLAARERTLALERRAASQGLTSATEVAALDNAVAEARARRDALVGQLDVRRKAMRADVQDAGWTWKSASKGLVERVECPPGQVARPDSGCLVIIDPQRAVVRVHVPERWVSRWSVGESMGAELVLAGETEARPLTEVRRAPRLDEQSRTLAVDFMADTILQSGRSGRASLTAPARGGLLVPEAAMTRLDGHEVVFAKRGETSSPVRVERLGRHGESAVVRVVEGGEVMTEVAVAGLFRLKSRHVLANEAGDEEAP
jgi:multidrug efflux pump subunit AcrA (membrane-fusion protein)